MIISVTNIELILDKAARSGSTSSLTIIQCLPLNPRLRIIAARVGNMKDKLR